MAYDGLAPSRLSLTEAAILTPYPTTTAQWRSRYDRLLACYLGEPYSSAECTAFHLFRALDDGGNEYAQAKRLFSAFRFIVDTDVAGVLGGGLTLEVGDGEADGDAGRDALLVAGEAVWNRSCVAERWEDWFTKAAIMGAVGIEVFRRGSDGRAVLQAYDPRHVSVYYDVEAGTELETVIIDVPYLDAPEVARHDGVIEDDPTPHTYRRVLTRDRVEVYVDGRLDERRSGPHKLGVVPFVWLTFKPAPDPEHGFSAAHGVEGAIMRADSCVEQIGAIGNRYGHPWIIAKGFEIGGGSTVGKLGRILQGVPKDGDLEGKVFGAEAVGPLLETIRECLTDIMRAPEFVFTEGGAGESGEARSYKAAGLEAKLNLVRNRWFPAIARATWYGTLMDRGQRVDADQADRQVFRIDAGPILPRNVRAEVEVLGLAAPHVKRADITRHLQRLGIVDRDVDPDAYAAEVADEQADRATQFFAAGGAGRGAGDEGSAR